MKINHTSLEKLRVLINEEIIYRSGTELVRFFNKLGFKDVYESGFPSRWVFTDNKLNELNNSGSIDKVIHQVFNPIEFINNEDRLESLIVEFNKYLEFDNYKLIKRKNVIEIKKLDNRIEILKGYSILQIVKYLKNGLIADIRNNDNGLLPEEYNFCRSKIIEDRLLIDFAPDYIKRYDDYSSVIDSIIQENYDFGDREIFINNSFKSILNYLESNGISIINKQILFNESYIHEEWQKAIKRNVEKDYD